MMAINTAKTVKTELDLYLERKNIFSKSKILRKDLNDQSVAKRVIAMINCDLSPENLCCDGELSRSQINKKERHLLAARQEAQGFLSH